MQAEKTIVPNRQQSKESAMIAWRVYADASDGDMHAFCVSISGLL